MVRRTRGSVLAALAVLAVLAAFAGCAPTAASGASGTLSAAQSPMATPTAEQRLAVLAQRAAGDTSVQSIAPTVDAGSASGTGNAVALAATLAGPVPATQAEIAASQERVKSICFRMEQAVWTSGMSLSEVKVEVIGPIYDDYADLTTGAYGAADLKAGTASTLDWTRLTPDTAWGTYGVWLRPAYRSKVLGQ